MERPVCVERSCLILAVPGIPADLKQISSTPKQNIQHKPLRGLVKYFKIKNCGAVVKLPIISPSKSEEDSSKLSGVLHAFPPSPYITQKLLEVGPSLQPSFFRDEYMLVYLVKGPSSIVVWLLRTKCLCLKILILRYLVTSVSFKFYCLKKYLFILK